MFRGRCVVSDSRTPCAAPAAQLRRTNDEEASAGRALTTHDRTTVTPTVSCALLEPADTVATPAILTAPRNAKNLTKQSLLELSRGWVFKSYGLKGVHDIHDRCLAGKPQDHALGLRIVARNWPVCSGPRRRKKKRALISATSSGAFEKRSFLSQKLII